MEKRYHAFLDICPYFTNHAITLVQYIHVKFAVCHRKADILLVEIGCMYMRSKLSFSLAKRRAFIGGRREMRSKLQIKEKDNSRK